MDEQIDVLLATYNGEKYLKEQIESILNQTYKNIRLIISDDCSKDGTVEIIKEYQQNDNRVILYEQPKNLGYVKNFEFLLTKVENEIYMLSDQDDVWKKEKIEKTYNKLKQDNADMVYTDVEIVDSNLKQIYPSFNKFMKLERKIKKTSGLERQYLYNCVTGCTVMSKKKFIEKMLPFPTNSKYLIHDMWMGIIVEMYGKVAYLDETTVHYRQHGNNQVGTEKISHGFTKFEDVRNLFINVKLGVFTGYVENNDRFLEQFREKNQKALKYYQNIKDKKYINFKGWGIFHKLYKNETLYYYILSFIIMNIPILGEGLFQIRNLIKKMRKA